MFCSHKTSTVIVCFGTIYNILDQLKSRQLTQYFGIVFKLAFSVCLILIFI